MRLSWARFAQHESSIVLSLLFGSAVKKRQVAAQELSILSLNIVECFTRCTQAFALCSCDV